MARLHKHRAVQVLNILIRGRPTPVRVTVNGSTNVQQVLLMVWRRSNARAHVDHTSVPRPRVCVCV